MEIGTETNTVNNYVLKAVILYWRLALFKVSGKALLALAVSLVTTLNGAEWSQFTPTQKLVGVITALGAMWLVIDAFLDTTLAELKKHPEGLGIPNGDTKIVKHTELDETTTTEVKPTP